MRPRKKSNNEKSHLVVLGCEASRLMEPQSATICHSDYLDMVPLKELFSYQNNHGSRNTSEDIELA